MRSRFLKLALIASLITAMGCAETLKALGPLAEGIDKMAGSLPSIGAGSKPADGSGDLGAMLGVLALGSKLTDMEQRRATTAFAAFGAAILIGQRFSELLSDREQEQLYNAQQRAAESDRDVAFDGERSGIRGSVRVIRDAPRVSQERVVEVPVLKGRVQQMPALDLIGAPYKVRGGGINVRGGPGTDYEKVGQLAGGQVVQVIGRVQGQSWYLVSERADGAAGGFVADFLLERSAEPAVLLASSEAQDVSAFRVNTKAECKSVLQEVMTPKETVTEEVRVCPQPDGTWRLAEPA